jgi:hypothetical protein
MGVPISGFFTIFEETDSNGNFISNTSIQGAINEANAGSVNNDTKFSELIAASTLYSFNPAFSGTLNTLSDVTKASQYRGYPYLSQVTLCYHQTSSTSACSCGTSGTYYIDTSSLQAAGNFISGTTVISSSTSGSPLAPAGFYSGDGAFIYWNGTSQGTDINGNTVNPADCSNSGVTVPAPSSWFGSGNLIGHFGTTGYSILNWKVNLQIDGYTQKNVTMGGTSQCLNGCAYNSQSRPNSNTITGSGSITVTRMADSSSNSNNQVNDDGDVQLVITEGTSNSPRPGISSSGSPNRYDLTNGTYRRANYTFTAGQAFSKTFVFTNLFIADGDTFQLDITEG